MRPLFIRTTLNTTLHFFWFPAGYVPNFSFSCKKSINRQTCIKRLLRSVFKLINCILTIYSFTPLSILNFLFSVTKIFFYSNSVTKQLIQVWHICSPSLPLPLYSLCLFCVLKQSPTCPSLIFSCIRYCSSFNSTALLTPIQLHLHTKKYVCVCKNEI